MSDITKSYKFKYRILKIVSFCLTFLPLFIALGYAFANGEPKEKLVLSFTSIIALIFVVLNVLFKYHIRSTIWILLLGVHFVISNITTLLIILAIATVLDEFIFAPLSKEYKNKYKINKEIDKRG